MFSPITAADNIKDEFIGYISTLFHISDKDYAAQFAAALREEGAIAKGPYLDVSDSYKTGKSLAQMIEEGEASSLFYSLEGDIPDGEKEIQINRGLYLHQERALRKANKGKNLIVTTGTGSGKTECFIIPIINHLLREAEEGTLSSGVRAILIYPMNALANDQMKRLRNLLKSYPEITFGVYNSSTKQNEQDGIAEYGKVYKDANGRPLKPLKNEIVSRDQMQKTPPHILVTNYAMLEYMMLRPKDDLVFSRAKLRFLVLDEAHIYRGATGMETSLLLKRLKARISNPANVLHILTSATLGGKEADDDIVKFAETLCNASFYAEDIIRSQSVVPSYDREPVDVPLSMFAELIDPQKPLNVIADDYGLPIPDGIPDAEYLYDLCVSTSVYRDLRRITSHPMTIPEITRALRATHNVTQQDVVNIIGVAAQASKNKSALIKARYHMFAKALEGAYVTLGQNKKLMLNRNRSITIGDENRKVFECAICDDCGRVAVAGKEVDGKLTECKERTGRWAWKHVHQADGSVDYIELKGNVVFDGVDFGYNDDKIVLHDVRLYAEPGQKIAFVGSTGAGKTTITNLINRFYDIQDGKIRYDGININKIKKADLRRSLGIVLQDTHLFTGTVRENIRFGKLDATDEEIVAAAKLANADGFIRRLPDGYDTVLTGDGANLSQGQRQLLAIARAAVADPPVLILDEATSSIDTRTERIIQESMDRLMKGRTTFVIAHRLSTVRNSDCIMVLEQGRIIERGTHEQLIEEKGRYYQLYTGNAISA